MTSTRAFLAIAIAASAWPSVAAAQRALEKESLLEYIRAREDLTAQERVAWEREIKVRFGGAAMDEDNQANTQITVAKEILSTAIFMEVDPKRAVAAAFEGYRGALGFVPPPLAVHYQVLVLEGRRPKGTPEQLTFDFPRYYNDEIAPELVAYWQKSLAEKSIPEEIVAETKEALAATCVRMRPLLADKLRMLAQLSADRARASGSRRSEVEADIQDLEGELARSFRCVAKSPVVLDRGAEPFERLKRHLADMGVGLSAADVELDPHADTSAKQRAREAERARLEEERRRREEEERERVAAEERRRVEEEQRRAEAERRARTEEERRRVAEERRQEEQRRAEEDRRRAEAQRRAEEERRREEQRRAEAKRPDAGGRALPKEFPKAAIPPRLASTIETWLGTPYLWGGTKKKDGTDCSGFTKGVAVEGFEIELPRVSRDQAKTGLAVQQAELQPGDLIFFDTADKGGVNHVGVYAGGGKFAHASSSRGVVYDVLAKQYYQKAYRSARRILDAR